MGNTCQFFFTNIFDNVDIVFLHIPESDALLYAMNCHRFHCFYACINPQAGNRIWTTYTLTLL